MKNLKQILGTYLSFLRSLYLLHQNNHWQTNGSNFYGNHKLFNKLYESAQGNADSAAEKIIGLFGCDCVDLLPQSEIINKILKRYALSSDQCANAPEKYIQSSLRAEKDFLELSQKVFDLLKENDEMTLGLDDMIMNICNQREEAVYLLKQSLVSDQNK